MPLHETRNYFRLEVKYEFNIPPVMILFLHSLDTIVVVVVRACSQVVRPPSVGFQLRCHFTRSAQRVASYSEHQLSQHYHEDAQVAKTQESSANIYELPH